MASGLTAKEQRMLHNALRAAVLVAEGYALSARDMLATGDTAADYRALLAKVDSL